MAEYGEWNWVDPFTYEQDGAAAPSVTNAAVNGVGRWNGFLVGRREQIDTP